VVPRHPDDTDLTPNFTASLTHGRRAPTCAARGSADQSIHPELRVRRAGFQIEEKPLSLEPSGVSNQPSVGADNPVAGHYH
jgi:hypothetical protein